MRCPLCQNPSAIPLANPSDSAYLSCKLCALIFMDPIHFLSAMDEKKRYDQHRNSPQDANYRSFLNQLFEPLNQRLSSNSMGLDFGSGPGPTLSVMLEEAGHRVDLYDIFYACHPEVFTKTYDFIAATEVLEHLRNPRVELDRLWSCLKAGGILGIMTKLAPSLDQFSTWYYRNDPTHVSFYSKTTFQWLSDLWQADLEIPSSGVVFLRKNS